MSDQGGSTPKAPDFEENASFSRYSPRRSSSPIASTSADTKSIQNSKNGKITTTKSSSTRPTPYPKPAEASTNRNLNITCTHCQQSLARSEFTDQQLKKRKNEFDGSFTIFCKICSPKQQVTAICSECDEILPASDFARNQLSKAEGARCIKCQRKIDKRNSKRRKQGGYSDDDSDEDSE